MIENISAKYLILKIYKWRRTFVWITLAATLITGVMVFLMPKQYQATVILFAARQFSISKLVVEANAGNQEDYLRIGDSDDAEKVMQVLNSDDLMLKVADAYDLWHRWKIDDTTYAYHMMKDQWESMVNIKRTEYNSIKIDVYDYTADGAAEIANGIAAYCDTIKHDMIKESTRTALMVVKHEYEATLDRMKYLEDSLQSLRELGVLHYKEQVKAYSKSYARAIEKNDQAAMKRLEAKLDTLQKYGGAYQVMHDDLDKYSSKYPDIKMKYDEALVNYNGMLPMKFVVERATPDEFKAKPKRLTYVIFVVIAANLIGLFVMLIKEKYVNTEPKGPF